MRTFTHKKEQKVWTVARAGMTVTVTWGKAGDRPRARSRKHASTLRAVRDENRRIREKLADGYVETTPLPPTSRSSTNSENTTTSICLTGRSPTRRAARPQGE